MIQINWEQDYQKEFSCYFCGYSGIKLEGSGKGYKNFKCFNCNKHLKNLCKISKNVSLRMEAYGLKCSNETCNSKIIVLKQILKGKKYFQCKVCNKISADSIDLNPKNINRLGKKQTSIIQFAFEDDVWDLRAINSNLPIRTNGYTANFNNIKIFWLKRYIKKYILHKCKLNTPLTTINGHLISLRQFSDHVTEKQISYVNSINRETILSFIFWLKSSKNVVKKRLWTVTRFFLHR